MALGVNLGGIGGKGFFQKYFLNICTIQEKNPTGVYDLGSKGHLIFVIEIDPELVEAEHIFAHELMHPVLRLLGVPTGKSLGAIDRSIGDEFTSAAHHPFVFDALDQYGYLSEHQEDYVICARS